MTKNGFFKTFKLKAVLFLTLFCLIFTSVAMLSACGDEEEETSSISYPSATKTEDDDALIKNGSFEYGSYNLSSTSFPISSSISGWSIALDNSAPSSSVTTLNKGGVVSKNSWKTTLEKITESSSFKTILKNQGIDTEKEYTETIGFKSEQIFTDKIDGDKVLMLNAYNTSAMGSAVKATSSNAVTLDKGATYELTVSVMTTNLTYNKKEGANIRLVNTIGGVEQAIAGINEINTDGEWKTYTLYVKADEEFASTVKVVLGLGRGGDKDSVVLDCVQGTAFFDNITLKKVDSCTPSATISAVFGSETENLKTQDKILYDMGVNVYEGTETVATTVSDKETFGASSINANEFKLIHFTVDTSALGVKDIYGATVYVLDSNDKETTVKTFYYDEEEQDCYILLKNNYPEGDAQNYSIKVKVGATDGSTTYQSTGSVDISDIDYFTGEIDKEDKTKEEESLLSLANNLANATVSLYAGYTQDYAEESTDTYTFNFAKTEDIEKDEDNIVIPSEYSGVDSDSAYVKNISTIEDGKVPDDKVKINEKVEKGEAGIINSKYTYSFAIPEKYEITNENKEIQPLFIKNNNEAYGFIAKDYKTVSASSYATISLKVFVEENAKAFIYIIDDATMEAMTISFNGEEKPLQLEIGKTEGWKTVNFLIATGANSKKFRIELWNGSRDGVTQTTGSVFFDDIAVSTSASSFESDRWEDLFVTGKLGTIIDSEPQTFKTATFTRELTDTEKAFNEEYPEQKVSYRKNYIWANSEYTVYAVYNTIDPVEVDPYASITPEEEVENCANTDPSSFWLSFSSIVLVAAMVIALVALILKNVLIKRKKNASDAKSHYKVTSRYSAKNDKKKEGKKPIEEKADKVEETENVEEVETENASEETNVEAEQKPETLDEYVYGDVQSFGENNEQPKEENVETPVEQPTEDQSDVQTEQPETVEQPIETQPEQTTDAQPETVETPSDNNSEENK